MRTDQEMPPETRRNHVGSSIIEGPWPAVTSGFLVGETPELQLGTSMLWELGDRGARIAVERLDQAGDECGLTASRERGNVVGWVPGVRDGA